MNSTPFQCETISSRFIAMPIAFRTLTSPRPYGALVAELVS